MVGVRTLTAPFVKSQLYKCMTFINVMLPNTSGYDLVKSTTQETTLAAQNVHIENMQTGLWSLSSALSSELTCFVFVLRTCIF